MWTVRADMEFDTFTVTFLETGPNTSPIDAREEDQLQGAHMHYLASLQESGKLEVAGPFLGPEDRTLRGMCLSRLPEDELRALFEKDPFVSVGRLTARLSTWMVPKGIIAFARARVPHSQAEL